MSTATGPLSEQIPAGNKQAIAATQSARWIVFAAAAIAAGVIAGRWAFTRTSSPIRRLVGLLLLLVVTVWIVGTGGLNAFSSVPAAIGGWFQGWVNPPAAGTGGAAPSSG